MCNPLASRTFLVWLLLPVVSSLASAQGIEKNKYQAIEVKQFEVGQGTNMPKHYQRSMMQEIPLALLDIGKFKHVFRAGEAPADANLPLLQLSGTVTKFTAGSEVKRFFIVGAGTTSVTAHVRFVDAATQRVLLEDDVDGKVILGGVVASESLGATRGLAKEIAKVTKRTFF